MQRRSLFQFDQASERSKTYQIQIPLLDGQSSSNDNQRKYQRQIKGIVDASCIGRKSKITIYESLCNILQKHISIINPQSNLLLIWNIINILAIFYNFAQIPIIIFIASNDKKDKESLRIFDNIDRVILTILFIDLLFVRFRVAYYSNEHLVTKYSIILQKYLSGGLIIDTIAFLVYFFDLIYHGYAIYPKLLFYIKLYTLLKIDDQILSKVIYNQYSNAFYKFIKMVGLIFFLTSFEACIYFGIDYYYYQQRGFNYQNGYLWLTGSQTTFYQNVIQYFAWPAWYLYALYFAVQTTSAVGYGNMTPRNTAEVLLCNIIMLTTICIFTIFADTIIDIVDELQQNTLQRQAKFTEINSFTRSNEVDEDTRKKVQLYFQFYLQSQYENNEQFLNKYLPLTLQQKLNLNFKSYIFDNLHVLNSIAKDNGQLWNQFARDLTSLLKVHYYSTGDEIQLFGSTACFQLSVIQSGKITAYNNKIDYKKDYRTWDYFGQKQFFFGGINLTNMICRTFIKFYSFQQTQFFRILKKHRSSFEKCQQMIDDVKFNGRMTTNFDITCYNCDDYHLLQSCPINILWRDKLPQPKENVSIPQKRQAYNRRKLSSFKITEWKIESINSDKFYISQAYFPYRNL